MNGQMNLIIRPLPLHHRLQMAEGEGDPGEVAMEEIILPTLLDLEEVAMEETILPLLQTTEVQWILIL